LETKLQEIRKYYPDCKYIAIRVDVDHVHFKKSEREISFNMLRGLKYGRLYK